MPLIEITGGKWEDFLGTAIREEEIMKMREHEHTGRPPGNGSFVENLENTPGRMLRPKKAAKDQRAKRNRYGVPELCANRDRVPGTVI